MNGIFLRKDLVLDVCEPYIELIRVNCPIEFFNMFKFGTFEFNNETYAFGTEENEYNESFNNGCSSARIPVVFARIIEDDDGETTYEFVSTHYFDSSELENIEDTIEYSLESQRVAMHYSTVCYG